MMKFTEMIDNYEFMYGVHEGKGRGANLSAVRHE